MLIAINPSAKVVKAVVETREYVDKKTNEKKKVSFLRVNCIDDDGDLGTMRFYEPDEKMPLLFVKGKPLPKVEVIGIDFESGVAIISARVI